jgi:pimeloyl-ACP methyl ester carboxylesterase
MGTLYGRAGELRDVEGRRDATLEMLSSLLSPVDAAVLTGDYAGFLVECDRVGLAPGYEGWWDDGQAKNTIPWGFELSSIRTPVLLLHGRQDRFVPFGHGEWLARQIPGVETWLTEEDGHMTFLHNDLEKILGWLIERI